VSLMSSESGQTDGQSIRWQAWGGEAFAQSAREDKPILLDIFGVWCHWCHVMDDGTYEHPEVSRLVNAYYVPVRVDTDQRPDINERYNHGGWPSTVILDPASRDLRRHLPAARQHGSAPAGGPRRLP